MITIPLDIQNNKENLYKGRTEVRLSQVLAYCSYMGQRKTRPKLFRPRDATIFTQREAF